MDGLPFGLSESLAHYRELAEQVRSLQDGVDRITATAWSPDGLVSAVVGGRGELIDLTIDPRVYRDQDATALAATVADTIRDAAGQAEQEATRLTEELVGATPGKRTDRTFGPALYVLDGAHEKGKGPWAR